MKKYVILLVFLLIVLIGLFSFSTWTNANVIIEDVDLNPGLGLASKVSPLLIGLFLIIGLAVVVIISVDR